MSHINTPRSRNAFQSNSDVFLKAIPKSSQAVLPELQQTCFSN